MNKGETRDDFEMWRNRPKLERKSFFLDIGQIIAEMGCSYSRISASAEWGPGLGVINALLQGRRYHIPLWRMMRNEGL